MNRECITDCINDVYNNSPWFILELPLIENNAWEYDINHLINLYYE